MMSHRILKPITSWSQFKETYWFFLFLTILVYGTSLFVPFYFDDSHTLVDNVAIRSLSNIPKFWVDGTLSSIHMDNQGYRPFLYVVFTLCWAIGKGAVWPFHVVKMIEISLLGWMLVKLWRILFKIQSTKEPQLPYQAFAWWSGVVWIMHPALVEVGVYISATSTLQCALFYVLGVYFYLRNRSFLSLCTSLLCFALAAFSKEEGLTFPAVLLLCEVFYFKNIKIKSLFKKLIIPSLFAILIAKIIFNFMPESAQRARGNYPRDLYFMTQWKAYWWYLKLWIWPTGLNADHLSFGFVQSYKELQVWLALLAHLSTLGLCIYYLKRMPILFFVMLWFYIVIAPASSVIPLSEPVNERRMVLSYLALAPLSIYLFWKVFLVKINSKSVQKWVVSIVLVFFYVLTQERIYIWQSPKRLWSDTVTKNPTNGRAMNNLGLIYMGEGNNQEAKKYFESCAAVYQYYWVCRVNLGIVYSDLGEYAKADEAYKLAIQFDPYQSTPRYFYALFKAKLNLHEEAFQLLIKADELAAYRDARIKYQLWQIAIKLNKEKEVIHELEKKYNELTL